MIKLTQNGFNTINTVDCGKFRFDSIGKPNNDNTLPLKEKC